MLGMDDTMLKILTAAAASHYNLSILQSTLSVLCFSGFQCRIKIGLQGASGVQPSSQTLPPKSHRPCTEDGITAGSQRCTGDQTSSLLTFKRPLFSSPSTSFSFFLFFLLDCHSIQSRHRCLGFATAGCHLSVFIKGSCAVLKKIRLPPRGMAQVKFFWEVLLPTRLLSG